MNRMKTGRIIVALLLGIGTFRAFAADGGKPNIVLILMDNLGYGEVGC
jgi:hypothetical protein